MMPSSRTSTFFLPSAVLLLVGTATSSTFSQTAMYNDAACEDLNSTQIIDGAYGMTGLEAFDDCTNLTSLGMPFKSSMYECVDSGTTVSYYEGDSCSGDAMSSGELSNNTCINRQIESCTAAVDWDITTDWTLDVVFYTDADCSTASGVTSEYTMDDVLAIYEMESCQASGSSSSSSGAGDDGTSGGSSSASSSSNPTTSSSNSTSSSSNSTSSSAVASNSTSSSSAVNATVAVGVLSSNSSSSSGSGSSSSGSSSFFSMNMALQCIDNTIGTVMYDGSDTTCSGGFSMAMKDESSCMASIFDEGLYMTSTCSGSSTSDDDEEGSDDDTTSGGASSFPLAGGGGGAWSMVAATAATATAAAVAAVLG